MTSLLFLAFYLYPLQAVSLHTSLRAFVNRTPETFSALRQWLEVHCSIPYSSVSYTNDQRLLR